MNLRRLRLKAVWLLIVPFLWLARPTPPLLTLGAMLATVGLAIRAWAAGTIHKERELTTGGPYAFTRNPLYLGSLFIGVGVTLAGGRWIFVVLFLVFFGAVYGRTMREEVHLLGDLFGERFEHYRTHVPAFLPRLSPYDPTGEGTSGFTIDRYARNREWEAGLGVVAGFLFLAVRWWLGAR